MTINIIFIVIGLLAALALVRNEVTHKIRLQQIEVINKRMNEIIDSGAVWDDWMKPYREFEKISYYRILFDITKWTRKQVYG